VTFKFSSKHHLLLTLLAEKPKRPIELAQELTNLTGKYFTDSTIWTLLNQLYRIRAIKKIRKGKKLVYYALTEDTLCTPDGIICIRTISPPILSFICDRKKECKLRKARIKELHGEDCPFFAHLRLSGRLDELIRFTKIK